MRIIALEAHSGRVRWTFEGEAGFLKSLHAGADRVHYLGYQDKLFALESATGQEAWRYNTENWTPSFTVAGDGLYFGSANAFVHALDPDSGRLLWQYNLEGAFNFPLEAPQRLGDVLYFQTVRQEVYALAADSGALLWRARHDVPGNEALVVGAERLFVTGRDGSLHAFALPR